MRASAASLSSALRPSILMPFTVIKIELLLLTLLMETTSLLFHTTHTHTHTQPLVSCAWPTTKAS